MCLGQFTRSQTELEAHFRSLLVAAKYRAAEIWRSVCVLHRQGRKVRQTDGISFLSSIHRTRKVHSTLGQGQRGREVLE